MIFSFLPPEVNSTLMYTGPGSGPLAAAMAGWEGLANDLQSTATAFKSIVTNLVSGSWTGPSSQRMVAAVEPYVAWLTETSAQAAQTAAQAAAAVNAYEAAYSATVPPALVFANRAQLVALIATNFFGQNTPAIAANEAQYAEMWVQDATAMNTYAVASTHTTALPQMAAPAAATNGTPQVAQAAAAANPASVTSSLISGLTSGIDSLMTDVGLGAYSGDVTSAITGALSGSGLSSASIEPIYLTMMGAYYGSMMASMPARMFMSMGSSMGRGAAGVAGIAGTGGETLLNSVASLVDGKMQAIVGSVASQLQNWGSSVSAQLGRATALGGLSIPHAWSEAATGAITRAAPILPNTSVPAPAASAALPGGPFGHALLGAMSGRGLASLAAKAPKVIPKSPSAG